MPISNQLFVTESSASVIIRGLLIAAPFLFFLVYVGVSGAKIKELQTGSSNGNNLALIQSLRQENDSLKQSKYKPDDASRNEVEKLQNEVTVLTKQNFDLQDQLKRIADGGDQTDALLALNKSLTDQVNETRDQFNTCQAENTK